MTSSSSAQSLTNTSKYIKHLFSEYDADNDKIISVFRCNGKMLDVELSSSYFINSPHIEERYVKFRSATKGKRSDTPEADEQLFLQWLQDVFETHFFALVLESPPYFS